MRRYLAALVVGALMAGLSTAPSPAVAAEDYGMETAARYLVDPDGRTIRVSIEVEFTNLAPDPPGQFTVFPVVDLAIHDGATEVSAEDEEGELEVETEEREGVHVVAVTLREPVRYEETVTFNVDYQLRDGGDETLRVGPSLVVFPAWSFGTSGEVAIELPTAFEVRVEGDPLEAAQEDEVTRLTSGQIEDPTRWVALVTAYRIGEYTVVEQSIPLNSGTVDLRVRAFEEDAAWGERTRDLLVQALPLMEDEIGLPYERAGPLVVVQSPPVGFGPLVEHLAEGSEMLVAFDAAPFTVLHQAAHIWVDAQLFGERWIREGLASHYAMAVAPEVEVEPPFDPEARAAELEEAAFPLREWREATPSEEAPERDGYGYAASWHLFDQVAEKIGSDRLSAALARIAAGVGAYDPIAADGAAPPLAVPPAAVDAQRLLDQLEVSGESVTDLFAERVFGPGLEAELAERAEAREAYASLLDRAAEWGAPEPVRELMSEWRFDEASDAMAAADAWLDERDELIEAIAGAGLSPPQRLHDVYLQDGGGEQAQAELTAQRSVVDEYQLALDAVTTERSLLTRLGLLGGPDPEELLASANRLFAAGELHDATTAVAEVRAQLATAEATGLVRLLAALAVVLVLLAGAALIVRRSPRGA